MFHQAGNFLWRINQQLGSLEVCKIQLMGLLVGLHAIAGQRVTGRIVICCALCNIIVGLETGDYKIKLLYFI